MSDIKRPAKPAAKKKAQAPAPQPTELAITGITATPEPSDKDN